VQSILAVSVNKIRVNSLYLVYDFNTNNNRVHRSVIFAIARLSCSCLQCGRCQGVEQWKLEQSTTVINQIVCTESTNFQAAIENIFILDST